jgi:3-hydroxybutyryl-CoA dehydratase
MEDTKPTVLAYHEIQIGDEASFLCDVTDDMIHRFAELSGDHNPLHEDEAFACGTRFGGRIAHGMLVGALFSRLVGMYMPGRDCLYLSQQLEFRKPVRPNTRVRVTGKVVQKTDAFRLLTLSNSVVDAQTGELYVSGKARTQVLDSEGENI